MDSKAKIITLVAIVLVIGAAVAFSFLGNPAATNEANAATVTLAQCLAARGATMYGTYWCSHCQNEKRAFGDAFRYVPYVECSEEAQRCVDAKIEGTPTWILGDGTRLVGEQGLEGLARATNCPYVPGE